MQTYYAQPISETKYQLGESPFYDPRTHTLSWVDITRGAFHCLSSSALPDQSANTCIKPDDIHSVSLQQEIGAAVPTVTPGEYLIAGTDGLYLLPTFSGTPGRIFDLTTVLKPYQRCNDAKADPMGRLMFGSSVFTNDHEACGNLYLLTSHLPTIQQADTRISNGMAWNKAHTRFYFSDSLYHAVFVYDYDHETGAIRNRQELFPITDGVPDGMCIDGEDNLWVAIWGGRRIEHRSGQDGRLLSMISINADNVTSCCFLGQDLDRLFITTSGKDCPGEDDGKLFSCKVPTTGLAPDYFDKTTLDR